MLSTIVCFMKVRYLVSVLTYLNIYNQNPTKSTEVLGTKIDCLTRNFCILDLYYIKKNVPGKVLCISLFLSIWSLKK